MQALTYGVAIATSRDEAAILEYRQAGVAQQKVSGWIYKAVLYVHIRQRFYETHYLQEDSLQTNKQKQKISI